MCGIIGRTGDNNAVPYLIDGLGKLEYRGYDSAGVAVLNNKTVSVCKAVGRLSNLKEKLDTIRLSGNIGIGHTRWATHGMPSEKNAHPHLSPDGRFAVVHNGIIENADILLKDELGGAAVMSDTDTEVIALLLQKYYNEDPVSAISEACRMLKGSYALGILCTDFPDMLFCTASSSPLVAAKGDGGAFIASDISAISLFTDEAYRITDGEICVIGKDGGLEFYDCNAEKIEKQPVPSVKDSVSFDKQGYEHYMLLEIMQQPDAVRNTIQPLLSENRICLNGINLKDDFLKNKLLRVSIVACGSAYHTGLAGQRLFEKLCRVPCRAEIASEFRYSDPLVDENTLAVFISQSGETADTLAALRLAKERGAKVLSIVNVEGSAIANESDNVIYTKAGREFAVATTKAYSAQLAVLYALSIYVADTRRTLTPERITALVHELASLPDKIHETIASVDAQAQRLAEELYKNEDIYFIGRQLDYAAAMEGSLKMKEISYIHSEAYASGELKHGTISLVSDGTPVIAFAADADVYAKTASNIREVQARGADMIIVTTKSLARDEKEKDTVFAVPDIATEFSVSLLVPPMQLLSYYTAKKRGCDIDKPKNLAKSVTVE